MSKPRSRKRDFLEKPPELLSMQLRLLEYLKEYWKWVVAGLVVVFIGLAAWGVTAQLQARRQEQAGAAMARIAPLVSKPTTAGAALKGLDKIIKDFSGTPTAREASLLRAHLLYQMGKYTDAAKAYEALAQGPASPWSPLITESLSYCYEAQGDYRKAAQILQPLEGKAAGPLESEINRRLAMLLEKAGEPQEAAKYWRKLLDKPPAPSLLPYIKEKLAAKVPPQKKAGEKAKK
ncbi:MAG: tetratricopeptide repeat protein [Syntrophales bacterium]|nr:tetratricopeptide repeat protein [Syntrophales bacterium]